MMKKTEEQAKKKSMHLVATFGAVTLIALGALAIGLLNQKDGKTPERIDLNATPTPGQPAPTATAKQDVQDSNVTAPTTVPAEGQTGDKTNQTTADATKTGEEISGDKQVVDAGGVEQTEEAGTPVLSPDGVISGLNFSAETGMLWPITGDVLMPFSPDHAIYHKTLDSYRTSNYVLLGGETGTHVSAAVDGVVTAISEELKTGTTITMQVSPNHEIVYGMLADITVKEGDYVDAGTVFATVAEPTKYFSEEGSGVYLQVLENDEPVNPMLFLQ